MNRAFKSALLEKCKLGDRFAQEELYNYYSGKLKPLCLRYSRSVFEAEDIIQEAFVKIFKNINNYNSDNSFDAWTRTIVVNTARDNYKKNKAMSSHIAFGAVKEEQNKFSEFNELSEKELLEIIKLLPTGYKTVFTMYAIEGYTHKEIAAILNISEGTSKSQLFKARRFIQQYLKSRK
ncbi:MAG TPA: RNA polymerase sigma factor [Cytophagaceae bacterium]